MQTQEQRLDEEMGCLIRCNDPFQSNVLWHVTRLWDRLSNVRYPGWERNESVRSFRAEVSAAIENLGTDGF